LGAEIVRFAIAERLAFPSFSIFPWLGQALLELRLLLLRRARREWSLGIEHARLSIAEQMVSPSFSFPSRVLRLPPSYDIRHFAF
jgi:hypothetical protein